MKTISLFLLIVIFGCSILSAQDFHGLSTYKSMRVANVIQLDSNDVNFERQKMIQEQISKHFQKTHTLTFNNHESLYSEISEEESLDKPNPSSKNVTFTVSTNKSIVYRNIKENRYVNEMEFLGKELLIKDALESYDWKITGETKNIGAYTCYKATRTRTMKSMSMTKSSVNEEDPESKNNSTSKEVTVVAWYTTDIPVNHGPGENWGLPGLILELNDGMTVTICNKIVLNPKEKITIKEPVNGKEVSQKEYAELSKKRLKALGFDN